MKLAKNWKKRDKRIETTADLISCYYSGFKIVCIPRMESAPSMIQQQFQNLRAQIKLAASTTLQLRSEADLLMDSEQLQMYFTSAFKHFSMHPMRPYNFLSAAFDLNPVKPHFKDQIISVAIRLQLSNQFSSGLSLFKYLAPLLASCILLDVSRKALPGRCMCSKASCGSIVL